jgi:hypothetical protein
MKTIFSMTSLWFLLLGCGGSGATFSTDLSQVDSAPLPDGTSDSGGEDGSDMGPTSDVPIDPLSACADDLIPALAWFEPQPEEALSGLIEFGQTHIVRAEEDRYAPPVTAERETLLLFTPDDAISVNADVRVAAFLGDAEIGALRLFSPDLLPGILEQGLTITELAPYSTGAWSATLPWHWVKEGVVLRIGAHDGESLHIKNHSLQDLGAPHRTTVTRTHMVLFGDQSDRLVPPNTSTRIAGDFFGSVPGAELRWVNTTWWRLDAMVVNTNDGPRWVHSEDERLSVTSDADRWNILKHQTALRLSLANTGRGLRMTLPPEGDNSPYSFGTFVAQGWVQNGDGNYSDINNAGLAAGWTGWTGMWLDECGNGFIHELGHSFTFAHFTGGTAQNWRISEEYPNDGVNLATHPWGYNTMHRMFRTWYRVNGNGPVTDGGDLVGKRDPMNGGESANSIICFPQYTGYHAQKAQTWQQDSPNIMNVDGVPGIYRWSATEHRYMSEDPVNGNQQPRAVDVPVLTLIGTLGNLDEVCQTYPPILYASGNAFFLPDPLDLTLPPLFNGAQWFLEISYEDGSSERALINRPEVPAFDTGLYLYSLNLEAARSPIQADLYRSPTGYPYVSIDEAVLVNSRVIEAPDEPVPGILSLGRGQLANGALRLTNWCDVGFNCGARAQESTFLEADAQISFTPSDAPGEDPLVCANQDDVRVWTIEVRDETGGSADLIVHAQRVVAAGSERVAVPANDQTPWLAAPDTSQSLRVWIPYPENQGLAPGHYSSVAAYTISALKGGVPFHEIPLEIDLTVHEISEVTLPPEYMSAGLKIPDEDPDSSLYYIFEDGGIGPATSHWWGDDTGNIIHVPVIDLDTGEGNTLVLRAHKVACGAWWGINTGQSAEWGCTHQVHLDLEPGANTGLVSGHSYSSPGSHPVVIKGVRWHEPNAGQILGTLALDINHTAP